MGLMAFGPVAYIGLGVVVLAVLGAVVLIRAWPRGKKLSPEERAELARAPMSPTQKGAWCGLVIGLATLGVIAAILTSRGAVEYWENDALRSTVVAIFIGGIVAHPLVSNAFHLYTVWRDKVDEREEMIVSRASLVQPPAILIALAVWMISLTERYHDAGAVPVVYLYLIFGSIILVMMIAQSFGVLLGHWLGGRHGQG